MRLFCVSVERPLLLLLHVLRWWLLRFVSTACCMCIAHMLTDCHCVIPNKVLAKVEAGSSHLLWSRLLGRPSKCPSLTALME